MYLKIRTNFEYLVKCFFVFTMLADTGFLLMLDISNQTKRLISGLGVIIAFIFLIYIFIKPSLREKALLHNNFLVLFLAYNIVVMLIHWIYAMWTYSIPWFNVFMTGHTYFSFITVPAFLLAFNEWNDSLDKMMKIVAYAGLICACFAIISGICIDVGLPVFFNGISYGYRDGHARVPYISICYYAIFYFFQKFLNSNTGKRTKLKCLLYICVMLSGMLYYVSTRMIMISVACALAVALILSNIDYRKKMVIILMGGILFFAGDAVQMMINSFSVDSDKGASTMARLMAIEYYRSIYLENPILGMGLVSPIRDDLVDLIFGPLGVFAFNDLGFLGVLYRLGIIGVPIFIAPLLRMAFISVRMFFSKCKNSTICVSITVFLLVSQISLNYLDFERRMVSSFYWALIEFLYFKEYYSKTKL